jgi:IS30 family transposase
MRTAGHTQKEIAKAIGKDKSVVSRELRRNCDQRNGIYKHDLAQRKHEKRQKEKPKRRLFDKLVQVYVDKYIKLDYSPEQIWGRAKLDGVACVSPERIYQYIWDDKKRGGDLHTHLRHQGRKYRKRGASKDSRGIIKGRVDIAERPAIVNDKKRLGDMEIDTVIGRNHKGALLTINDRVSSKVWIAKLDSKDSQILAKKAVDVLLPYQPIIHTITSDNGKEFADHVTISEDLKIDFYFAAPYSPWERGANENTNGLVRQYFRKGTSFESITDEQVQQVQDKLNNRPRKKLNYLTPNEYFELNLSNTKVAFIT